jgi:hypothetical protein
MAVFIIAGLVGETLSLIALATESASAPLRFLTLAALLVLVGLGALLLSISLCNVLGPLPETDVTGIQPGQNFVEEGNPSAEGGRPSA